MRNARDTFFNTVLSKKKKSYIIFKTPSMIG